MRIHTPIRRSLMFVLAAAVCSCCLSGCKGSEGEKPKGTEKGDLSQADRKAKEGNE